MEPLKDLGLEGNITYESDVYENVTNSRLIDSAPVSLYDDTSTMNSLR